MINITCATSSVTIDETNLNITDVASLLGSPVIQQMFGISGDMVAEVNGNLEDGSFQLADEDEIVLTTKAHDKGAEALITIRNGVNTIEFDLEDIGSTAAEILASSLVQMTFGTSDDMQIELNGSPVSSDSEICEGDEVVLSTKAHDKGAEALITIRNGVNAIEFDLEDIGSTAAEILASSLVQMTFGTSDDMQIELNGSPVEDASEICEGDEVVLSTKAHDKGLIG